MRWRPATLDDPALRPLLDLRAARDRADVVIVEGEIAVGRALAAGWPVAVVLATEAAARTLPDLPAHTEGRIGPPAMLRAIAGFDFHRGCLAVAGRPHEPDARDRLVVLAGDPRPWTIVVAEGLADPVNVGALVRNARAFGAAAVVLVGGADPFAARAVRASMGHVFAQPVVRARSVADAIDAVMLACPDVRVLAATVDADACALDRLEAAAHTLLLVGAEGPGLGPDAIARAHERVTIPIAPEVDSLNVAAATAVLLWALRQGS